MAERFNYNILLNQALIKIQDIRNPQSVRLEYILRSKQAVDSSRIVSLGGMGFDECKTVVEKATSVITECIEYTIMNLFKAYGVSIVPCNVPQNENGIVFAFADKAKSCLLAFKEPEKDLIWRLNKPPKTVAEMMQSTNTDSFKLVYLLYDNAEKQAFSGSKNSSISSLKWLFETYFTIDEFEAFHRCFSNFIQYVNDFLGFTVSKTLNGTSQVNFRRVVMNRIACFNYDTLVDKKMNGKELPPESFPNLKKQFLDDKAYLTLLGESDFAESFVTSEWMYDTMREAHSIDLTPIALGYFKFAEQLLFSYLLINKDNNLQKKAKDEPPKPIDVEKLENDSSGTTLGPMAHIFKDNPHILRNDLPFKTRRYLAEAIFVYKDLRNGYLHKNNIRDWRIINIVKEATYHLAFLLLGTAVITDDGKGKLGYPEGDFSSDKYLLCEYVNYHADEPFFLCFGTSREVMVLARRDPYVKPQGKICFQYSGAYFAPLGEVAMNIFDYEMPKEIYLGNLGIQDTEMVNLQPCKETKVFDNGKFVGPNIHEELGTHY